MPTIKKIGKNEKELDMDITMEGNQLVEEEKQKESGKPEEARV